MNEDAFNKLLVAGFAAHDCVPNKLHGNMYQSGLPDWLIAKPFAGFLMVEAKAMSQKTPTIGQLVAMLRPLQRKNLSVWSQGQLPAFIAASSPNGFILLEPKDMPRLLSPSSDSPLTLFADVDTIVRIMISYLTEPRFQC